MTTAERIRAVPPDVRQLRNGDRMDAQTFHRIYQDSPENFRAELVGGIVHLASPLGLEHAVSHSDFNGLFWFYARSTKGVQCGDSATIRLGDLGEPQPDLFLRILPEFGGQSRASAH